MRCAVIVAIVVFAPTARAGLHCSAEPLAELPAQWRGFLLDHRALRTLAAPPGPNALPHPLRDDYRAARDRLVALQRPLTADEAADLGALHLRLGAVDKALAVLRGAHREHPEHFRAAANLGTAWQLAGDLDAAALTLREAVRLAPPKLRPAEELHLRLVQRRRHERRDAQALDDLFGLRPGDATVKLPADAVALAQRLALTLPADGRLLWQLGELTALHGDLRTAAAMLDGCVTEFGLSHPELRRRRHELRAAAGDPAKAELLTRGAAQTAHEGHRAGLTFRSPRPLARRLDTARLPPIRPDGLNPLPWSLLAETPIDGGRPRFPDHLGKLDGKKVALTGFMLPLGDDLEVGTFLLMEFPVGCWFCEVPEPTGIVLVELPEGKSAALTRELVKIEGRLSLNATDPEQFLYTVREARVGKPD